MRARVRACVCARLSLRVFVCVYMCVCVFACFLFFLIPHIDKKTKDFPVLSLPLFLSTGFCSIGRLSHPPFPLPSADMAHASSSHKRARVCASSTNFRSSILFTSSPPRRTPLPFEKVGDEFVVKAEAEGCFWVFLARNAAAAFADPGTQDRALVCSCIRWA